MRTSLLTLALAGIVAAAPVGAELLHGSSAADPAPSRLVEDATTRALDAAPGATAGLPPAIGPTSDGFELVGHDPLGNRGMNAALAVHGDYAYVGSRTDGKPGDENLNGAGILVVDISDPTSPEVVHEIGPPHQGLEGQTSREMRIWPDQELLIVENLGSNCSELIHACSPRGVTDTFDFYDISGDNAADPQHVATYDPSRNPHEFYLWIDPDDPERALLYISATSSNRLLVTDISRARDGGFVELVDWAIPASGGSLHSMTPTVDGRELHLAYLTGGYYIADTSAVVDGAADPTPTLVTPEGGNVEWDGPGAHSALRLPGRDVALVADEVYGEALRVLGHGCPWGWVRFVDLSDPTALEVIGEFRTEQNHQEFCTTDEPRPSSSYSAHNPTVTENVAFLTWHAGGLRAISLDDPTDAAQAGVFVPEPLDVVLQEDPALTAGQDKVAMWSFPIIQDGLIYVVDLRNGLYVLEYTGPGADEVGDIRFLEGNSNLGDAIRIERRAGRNGPPADRPAGNGSPRQG